MAGVRLRPKGSTNSRAANQENINENEAASAIQAWFQGNVTRLEQENKNLLSVVESGETGASGFSASNSFRRRKTVKMTEVVPNVKSLTKETVSNQIFFAEEKFRAYLKGIIDIQGRMTDPFTVLINFGPRNPAYDDDYTKYPTYFALHVDKGKTWFSVKLDSKDEDLSDMTEVVVSDIDMGLDEDTITTYWLSYDRDNLMVKYGKGYAMTETTLLMCDFSEAADTAEKLAKRRKKWSTLFAIYDEKRSKDISILLYRTREDIIKASDKNVAKGEVAGYINMESMMEVRKEPLTANPSPFVLDSEKATLNIIDKGLYIFSSELPAACKVLYDTIKRCQLDLEYDMGISEVRLSDAIRYSINTEGALLHSKLKTKAYLRITMGKGRGESPGIPYVLEIWPKGARSPIHNHGAVCAVIKVLYGTIQSGCYNKVTSSVLDPKRNFRPTELLKFNAFKDEVTWMSPEWYQTHQLRNVSDDYCATVQCYRYDDNDNIQWNQFDYVKDENGEVGNFFPNTDFTFGQMRDIVLKEWSNRLNKRL